MRCRIAAWRTVALRELKRRALGAADLTVPAMAADPTGRSPGLNADGPAWCRAGRRCTDLGRRRRRRAVRGPQPARVLDGPAPLDASSREQIRNRLSRAGNRKMNHMLHIAAATQASLNTSGRAYYRRKLAADKTRMEGMKLPQETDLRRGLSTTPRRRRAPRAHCDDQRCRCGSGRALRGVLRIQRRRPAPTR